MLVPLTGRIAGKESSVTKLSLWATSNGYCQLIHLNAWLWSDELVVRNIHAHIIPIQERLPHSVRVCLVQYDKGFHKIESMLVLRDTAP